jgi:ribose 5-phosphate isomerase A
MSKPENWVENARRLAAAEAVKNIKDGFIVGLGSGRTVIYALTELVRKIRSERLEVLCVSTSSQIMLEALRLGLKLTSLYEHPVLDVTLDGADEVDGKLNLTKGGGGCLTREKIVASASKQYIVIVDENKLVDKLGSKKPIPIEVLPFAMPTVKSKLERNWGKTSLREGSGKLGPVITDNGNYIVDLFTGPIEDPWKIEREIKLIPGVVEIGLFLGMTSKVYVGRRDSLVQELTS